MALNRLNLNPSPRELWWFTAMLLLFCGAIGAILSWRGHAGAGQVAWIASAALGAPMVLIARVRRWSYLTWMHATFPIGWALSHVVLAVTYYGVLTPIGLLLRCLRHDPMRRRINRSADSYWLEREPPAEPQRYFQQY